jgi:plastocyanin
MPKSATPADSSTTLTISFSVMVDPETDKVTIAPKPTLAIVQGGQDIAWEITNTLPKTIKVSVVGLDSSMVKGFKSTMTLKGGEIKSIVGTVKNPGLFKLRRTYAIWATVNGKQIAVDPDLEVERPPDGTVVVKNATTPVDVKVTLSDHFVIDNDPAALKAAVGQGVTWTITNQSSKKATFEIAFPGGAFSFDQGIDSVDVPARAGGKDGKGTLSGTAAAVMQDKYGERVEFEGVSGNYSKTPEFTFTHAAKGAK